MRPPCILNPLQASYVINYWRITHKDFKYKLKMRNPNRVKSKVIVRLWLIPTKRKGLRVTYHPSKGFVGIFNQSTLFEAD